MRKLRRSALAPVYARRLQNLELSVRNKRSHDERYQFARAQWPTFRESNPWLKDALIAMNAGRELCMYCEYSEAGTIDHFCPRAKDPKQSFHWKNLLWACERCQTAKRASFSRLLLNPARNGYAPWDHMDFVPDPGILHAESPEAKVSEPIFGWNRGELPEHRWQTFMVFQAAIIAYARAKQQGDEPLSQQQARLARATPCPGVFDWILHWADAGPPINQRLDPSVREALRDHPEIYRWLR